MEVLAGWRRRGMGRRGESQARSRGPAIAALVAALGCGSASPDDDKPESTVPESTLSRSDSTSVSDAKPATRRPARSAKARRCRVSAYERRAARASAADCPEPALIPAAEGWWREVETSCPAGTKLVRYRNDICCLLPNGRTQGAVVTRYRGHLSAVTVHCKGVIHGPSATWHSRTGKLKEEGQNRLGKRHGLWKIYYASGELKDEVEYRDGELHGSSRFWSRDGRLVTEQEWKSGTRVTPDP